MKIIKEKKINRGLLKFLLYLSFCMAGWYAARSSVASVFSTMSATSPSLLFMCNEFTAFFVAGVFPFVLYLIVTKIFENILKRVPFLPVNEMFYALPFFYIGANLVIGLFSILYYFVPLASVWGNIVVPFVSTACFFVWFLAYICKNYVKKYNWKAIVMYFGRMYLVVATILTVINLLVVII